MSSLLSCNVLLMNDTRARLGLFISCQVELLPQVLLSVGPIHFLIPADEPAYFAASFFNRVAAVLVNPPRYEVRYPAINVRVAGRPDVWLYAPRIERLRDSI